MSESWLIVLLALGLGSLVKGATGMGLPMVATPLLAATSDLPRALSVLVVPIIVTNVWQVWQHRRHRGSMNFLAPFLGFGLMGLVAGTFLLVALPREAISLLLGCVLIAYIAMRLSRPSAPLSPALAWRLAPVVGFLAGTLQGAMGLSGPIAVPYLHAMRLEREPYLFAVSSLFLLCGVAQSLALGFVGLLEPYSVLQGAIGLASIAVMMPIGNALGRAMSRRVFDLATLALLAVIAASLLLPLLPSF